MCLVLGSLLSDSNQHASLKFYLPNCVRSYSSSKFLFHSTFSSSLWSNSKWFNNWYLGMECCYTENMKYMALAMESDDWTISNLHWTVIWARKWNFVALRHWYFGLFFIRMKLYWLIHLCHQIFPHHPVWIGTSLPYFITSF